MELHILTVMWSSPLCEVNAAGIGTTTIPVQSTSHNGEADMASNQHIMSFLSFSSGAVDFMADRVTKSQSLMFHIKSNFY